jgi:amino acid permease
LTLFLILKSSAVKSRHVRQPTDLLYRFAALRRCQSYGTLVREVFGSLGASILQLSIIIHVSGVMVVYLVIMGDILIGTAPTYSGVLPTLLPGHVDAWYMHRETVVGLIVAGVITPMLVPRNLTAVARFSKAGVIVVLLLAGTVVWLAGIALANGTAARDTRWMPDFATSGILGALGAAATVMSVSCLAFTCQFNLLPIQSSLADPRAETMYSVVRRGVATCAVFYSLVGCGGYLLFGSATQGDVLNNLSIGFVESIGVPTIMARLLIMTVAGGYCVPLAVNFVLKVWAVRDNISELVLGVPARDLASPSFYSMTLVLVAASLLIASLTHNFFTVVALVGATACVTFTVLFPGALLIKHAEGARDELVKGAALFAVGLAVAGISISNQLGGLGGA